AAAVEFDTFWKPVDQGGGGELHYLPEDPQHPALSYSIDAGLYRWGLPILLCLMGLLMPAGGTLLPRQEGERAGLLREVAEDGEEVLYPLLRASSYRQTWTVVYETSPGAKATWSSSDEPLIALRDGKQHVVALRSPRSGTAVLMPKTLAVFDLPI